MLIPRPETELLVDVNRTLNRIRFIDDAVHWGQADYWATPAESVGSDGGATGGVDRSGPIPIPENPLADPRGPSGGGTTIRCYFST